MKKSMLIGLAALSLAGYQAQASQGTAKAQLKVLKALNVSTVSNLVFSDAFVGSPEETVAAGFSEDPQNASFFIVGEANRPVTVTLPADGTVNMTMTNGGSDVVAVNQFTSNPISDLGPVGTVDLFVGATRAALSPTQAEGEYEGDFVVDVVY